MRGGDRQCGVGVCFDAGQLVSHTFVEAGNAHCRWGMMEIMESTGA